MERSYGASSHRIVLNIVGFLVTLRQKSLLLHNRSHVNHNVYAKYVSAVHNSVFCQSSSVMHTHKGRCLKGNDIKTDRSMVEDT